MIVHYPVHACMHSPSFRTLHPQLHVHIKSPTFNMHFPWYKSASPMALSSSSTMSYTYTFMSSTTSPSSPSLALRHSHSNQDADMGAPDKIRKPGGVAYHRGY
eukprot:748887-Hanusia_phi.AAC.1